MRRSGFNVGGEQSGHIILSDYATTGDGLIAALQFLACVVETGKKASAVARVFEPLPQVLRGVRYGTGQKPLEHDSVKTAIAEGERRLDGKGRLLIRKSGTEPVIRVMAEGEDSVAIACIVDDIIAAIEPARSEAPAAGKPKARLSRRLSRSSSLLQPGGRARIFYRPYRSRYDTVVTMPGDAEAAPASRRSRSGGPASRGEGDRIAELRLQRVDARLGRRVGQGFRIGDRLHSRRRRMRRRRASSVRPRPISSTASPAPTQTSPAMTKLSA